MAPNSFAWVRLGKETQRICIEMLGNGIEWKRYGCADLRIAMYRHGNDGIGKVKSGDGLDESRLVEAPKRVDTPWRSNAR